MEKPILCEDEKDERYEGVVLLEYSNEKDEETKTTAEDCGDYWLIREWETMTNGTKDIWFARWTFSVSKKHIQLLSRAVV